MDLSELTAGGNQVCRLCGQSEKYCINVFSEEGTRRFLNFKIHQKINILIDERDPLPKVICVQCLGKLEFVCDFQEECLRTQRMLHDQYNLPPFNVEEQKPEESIPSTSANTENGVINNLENNAEIINKDNVIDNSIHNNNNNNSDKNFNPPENEVPTNKNASTMVCPKPPRSLRSQQNQTKSIVKNETQDVQVENDENLLANIQQPEITTTTTRRLRSRQSTESSDIETSNKNPKRASIRSIKKKRLRSHNNTVDSTTNSQESSNTNQNTSKKNSQVDQTNKIQIPTNTLNKVLSAITNAPGIGVAVKEPSNRTNDAEDISFTVELSKKQETDSVTVLAKVFPDQGSCLVDKSIVTFLEDGTNEEVNNLVHNIVSPAASKDEKRSLIDKLQNAEDIANSSRNPEELFKMDGEEIHVDDNVEQINVNNQIKPDDGLPQVVCLNCIGKLEFICDFQKTCHDTQKSLESSEVSNTEKEVPKDKLESDADSDKENVLPKDQGKRSKSAQLEQTKVSTPTETEVNATSKETEFLNDRPVEKTTSTSSDNSPDNEKSFEKEQQSFDAAICDKSSDQSFDKENTPNTITKTVNLQISKEKVEIKKVGRRSKIAIETKNKKLGNKQNRTLDKYFVQSKCKEKNIDEENIDPNNTETNNTEVKEDVVFEGTIISDTGDTSFILPIKAESFNEDFMLNNDMMADDSKIVRAQDIILLPNNSDSSIPEKPEKKPLSTNSIVTDSISDNTVENIETLNDINSNTHVEKVLVLEVQLPAKDNPAFLPKTISTLRKNRSLSTSSSERRSSEGKYAKISELMSEKQKKDIETHYTIDMSRVDEPKVNNNITVLEKSKYRCKICETTYPRLDKCHVHVWRHLDMKPYLCKLCDFSTLTVSNIRCHIRKSHLKIKPFECHVCQKRYNSATLLEEHLNVHTGERPYQCQLCDFASTSKQVLSHHLLIHKDKKDIECDICGKAFYSKSRMRAHRVIHDKKRTNKCKLCSAYILHEHSLERHYMKVHMKDYVCKICNKVYKSKKALHNHESVHSEAKFKCHLCPNVYKSTHILKEHLLKHQGIRKYQCNKCDKKFGQQSHLAAHMAVHSNVTYNCPGCKKGFNRHDNMKVHTKRCELFLANPELQKLLSKRKISFSKNNTAKVSTQKHNSDLNDTESNDGMSNSNSEKTIEDEPMSEDLQEDEVSTTENVLARNEF